MFGPAKIAASSLVLTDTAIVLRPPQRRDHGAWANARAESRAFLEEWEPVWTEDELSRRSWRNRVKHANRERARGTGFSFLITKVADGAIAGGITISNVRRGVSQSGQIGYWMHVDHAGQGHMARALGLVTEFAFKRLLLHRIEAACIPGNERSVRLLEKAGFSREGLLKAYLRINGRWQDHYLYALINDADGERPKE